MAWIKFEKDLLTDPRVLRMAKSLEHRWKLYEEEASGNGLGVGNDQALPAVTLICGALVRIWSLADTHVGSDDVLPLGRDELDEVVGIPGFCALMPIDWLEPLDDHSVRLPNFHAHNGTEAKRKAVTQKRVAAFRGRNASSLPDQTRKDQTRPGGRSERASRAPEFKNNTSTAGGGWWKTEAGIDAKGKELGIPPRPGEGYPQYKERLFENIKPAASSA